MRINSRRLAVFIVTIVAAACLLGYLATTSITSSAENPFALTVSKTTVEGGQMLVAIATDDFPRTRFKKLTYANLDTEIKYNRTEGVTTLIRRPKWKMTQKENDMLFSVSLVPSNETVTIEISLSEYPRFSPFSSIVRTNWYRWSKQF